MVGKIDPALFPHVFGPHGDLPLDAAVVRERFAALAADVAARSGHRRTPEAIAEGFLQIAVDNMAHAIKHISVERGYDVTEYTLCCFGGAGGQHACAVADALGMTRVFIHPLAGVLSAYGMGLADVRALRQRAVEAPLSEAALADVEPCSTSSRASLATKSPRKASPPPRSPSSARCISNTTAPIPRWRSASAPIAADRRPRGSRPDVAALVADFEQRYRTQYGFLMPGKALIIEAAAVEAIGAAAKTDETAPSFPPRAGRIASRDDQPRVHRRRMARRRRCTPAPSCGPGDAIAGPAVVAEKNATTVIEPGWQATLTARDHLVLERTTPIERAHAIGTSADPVLLEVFNNLFMAIAEQMGVTLANTAYSVNIKERLDFSCALFDAEGNLIANAPHMPVHLGSMGESVRTIIDRRAGTMQPGDVFVLNAPYNGGTHLPDVTVIAPVFLDEASDAERGAVAVRPEFYVASRGHHADIGGTTPGSMPPDSTHVDEEGVLLDNVQLVAQGRFLDDEMRAILALGTLSVAQRRPESRRPAGAGRGVREGHRRAQADGRAFRPRRSCART